MEQLEQPIVSVVVFVSLQQQRWCCLFKLAL